MDPTELSDTFCGVGKIKSVRCKDFVTYDECTFYPTEYLNVVIGPNGTGKSTLVAAIVLGLGGDPKVLSRASSVKDYIKNGKTAADIVVEIIADSKGKCMQFHRNFSETCKSEYKINGDVVGKTNFLKKVSEFKIQINNLCQFLPQDRVQDFAKMNPQEILASTITSVCNKNIIENFGKLKELRDHQQKGKRLLETNLQKHRESLTRLEELKQILERYNKRKQILEKRDICIAKKLWLELDQMKQKINEIVNDLNEAKRSLVQRRKTFDEIRKEQEEITKKKNELIEDVKKKINISKGIYEQKNKTSQEIEEAKKGIREAKTDFENKQREWFDRQRDLRHEATMLAVIVEDLKIANSSIGKKSETESSQKSLQEQLDELKLDIKEYFKKLSDINKKLDEECMPEIQMLKKRLEHSKNVAEQKLQLLRNNFADVYKAVLWLEKNKQLFQGMVYTPMLLELNVCDPRKSKYFENTIPLRDLLSFICENKSDVSILVNELCIKQKIQINVAHSPSATECRYKPDEPITNLQKFGFKTYLIDLLEGPPAVLNYLCYSFKLHNIPIGTEQVNRHTDSIPTHIRQYFGGDQRYNISVSKYSKERSLMQSHVEGKNLLLGCDMNIVQNFQQRLNELLKKSDILKNERTSIEGKIDTLEYQCQEINNKRRAIESTVTRFSQLRDKCKRQEHKIRHLKENVISISDMENAFKGTSHLLLIKIIELNKEKVHSLQSYQKAIAKLKLAEYMVQLYNEQTAEITNAIDNATDNLKQSQKVVDSIAIALDNSKKKCQVKVLQALKSTNYHKPSDVNFPYTEMFEELPNELEQLKEVLNDFAARLDCLSDVDQEIVTEYEQRCTDIKTLEKDILDNVRSEKNITGEISSIYTKWYPEINGIVDTLNDHFGKFMDSMSYVGEVFLAKNEDFDFDSYGIQIMVQYRKNVPLQSLDRNVQSGGERAVAIAVYTLSLQHITHVPFRCVDEINQGMDARNERKIFEMLVNETTKTGRSQYFFVTPKLLPKLRAHERMTVHVVFNGKMVQGKDAFSFQN